MDFDQQQPQVVSYEKPHARPANLDPKHHGPYLDDIRADQERAYREARMKALGTIESESESDDTQDLVLPFGEVNDSDNE